MNAPRWLDDEEMRAWLGYRRMRTLLDARIDRDLTTDSGLSPRDYDVLSRLSDEPDDTLRFRDLAGELRWSASRLSHHLGRMAQRGLVHCEDHPDDGRAALVRLSDTGRAALLAAAPGHVASVRDRFLDLLTPEQIRTLGDIAETVLAKLPKH